jgi:hypothetical protein
MFTNPPPLTNDSQRTIRLFILRQLQEPVGLRDRLDVLAFTHEMDSFEAMEFYENEVARIEKLFNYPSASQSTALTTSN